MKKYKWLFLILVLFIFTGCQKNSENVTLTKVKLALDWAPNTNHTGIYVAKEKGYFKEVGLDVEIIQPSEDGAELMVASNVAQFGISFQDTLAASFAQGLPLKTIAAISAHNTSGILTRADKNVTRPKDLEGLNYATWNLPIEQAMMKQIITQDGGQADRLKMVYSTVTDSVSALQSNIDALWVYAGWDLIAVKQAGLATNYLSFKEINPIFDYYTPVLITNQTMLNTQKEIVQKLVSALAKGYTDSIENPTMAAEILLKAVPELSPNLVKESQLFLAQYYKDNGKPWGYIDATRWNAFYNWLNTQNILQTKLEENTGFTNEFIEN